MFYKGIRPFLFLLPPETAHAVALNSLKLLSRFKSCQPIEHDPVELAGLYFSNQVGIAAGLDKNGDYIDALCSLGCSFIEVGGVTPKPQAGNPKPRLFRLAKQEALINRMGFNNKGVEYLIANLKRRKTESLVGVNIGKNKGTPLEVAYKDYSICLKRIEDHADFVTVNISSPNTPRLRDLHQADFLEHLIMQLKQKEKKIPLFVKLSPDLKPHELEETCDILLSCQVDGIIATNTTVERDEVGELPISKERGGLSGEPLFERSHRIVSSIASRIQGRIPLIAVGGINSPERARIMLNSGADLVQLYTGLIYEGPGLVKQIITSL